MMTHSCSIFKRGLLLFTILSFAFASSVYAAHIFEPWHDDVYVAVGRDHGPKSARLWIWLQPTMISLSWKN
jgi:hypothetical protein